MRRGGRDPTSSARAGSRAFSRQPANPTWKRSSDTQSMTLARSGDRPPTTLSRLADCEAGVLITADGFRRRGSVIRLKDTSAAAVRDTPTVRRVLVVRRLGDAIDVAWTAGRDRWWDEALNATPQPSKPATPETDPETPYMIIYTSGTTGRPKGAVHVHGGFPVKGAQDLAHQFDLGRDDALFWFTDLGWMMGPG